MLAVRVRALGLPAVAASRLPHASLRLARGAEHLHRCGPRTIASFLALLTLTVPERMALLDKLDRWRRDIDPVRARAGGYTHPCIEWRVLENEMCEPRAAWAVPAPRLQVVSGAVVPKRGA